MALIPITPTIDSTSDDYSPLLKSESAANYPKVRRLTDKTRKKFNLKFTNIKRSDYDTLRAFFLANQGLIMQYYDPNDDITYDVVSMQDSLPRKQSSVSIVSTEWKVEEV